MKPLAAAQRGDKMNFAGFAKSLAQTAVGYFAINCYGNVRAQLAPLAEARFQPRETCFQLSKQLANRLPGNLYAFLTTGQLAMQRWNPHFMLHKHHQYQSLTDNH